MIEWYDVLLKLGTGDQVSIVDHGPDNNLFLDKTKMLLTL